MAYEASLVASLGLFLDAKTLYHLLQRHLQIVLFSVKLNALFSPFTLFLKLLHDTGSSGITDV